MKKQGKLDFYYLTLILLLLSIGILMVYSSSSYVANIKYGTPHYFFLKQLSWSLLGIVSMLTMSKVPLEKIKVLAIPFLLGSFLLLILVLVPGIGVWRNGSYRWLSLGNVLIQPSEIMKLAMIFFLAYYYSVLRTVKEKWTLFFPILVVIAAAVLIYQEPDLGTAVSLVAIAGGIIFATGMRYRYIGIVLAGVAGLLFIGINNAEYRLERYYSYLDPWLDPLGDGYQIIRSLLAIGSGGIIGKGLAAGTMKKFWLPEMQTDFIYPIIVEELGSVGGAFVILLFALLIWRGLVIAQRAKTIFQAIIALGVTLMIAVQAAINIGVAIGVIPVTGMPLPLISYGGTSLLLVLTGLGMVLNVSRNIKWN